MTGKTEKHEDKKASAQKQEPGKSESKKAMPAPRKAADHALAQEPGTKKATKPDASKTGKKFEKLECITCGISVESEKVWVEFRCPACRKETITRCDKCKRLENTYTCPGCGFVGP